MALGDRGPAWAILQDGRLHFHHGPIDLIISLEGPVSARNKAAKAAWQRFAPLLAELVQELDVLRAPLADPRPEVRSPVARRMIAACWPYRDDFITPMAAVAGSVADEILDVLAISAPLDRAIVNNGGDVAFRLAADRALISGIVADVRQPRIVGTLNVCACYPERGIATSGWRGRSQSLGIADVVTVLADSSAAADAAATMIANAVNAEHPAIRRRPAVEVKIDSDLGDRLVTVDVGTLPEAVVAAALDDGRRVAEGFFARGLIGAALIILQEEHRTVGPMPQLMGEMPSGLRSYHYMRG